MLRLTNPWLTLAVVSATVGSTLSLARAEDKDAAHVETGVTKTGVRWMKPMRLPIHAISFWPDGSKYATSSGKEPYAIQIWEAKSHKLLHTIDAFWVRQVHDLAISPDGKHLAIESGDAVQLLDGVTYQQKNKMAIAAWVFFSAVAYSHDGKWIAAAATESKGDRKEFVGIQLWTPDGKKGRSIPIPDAYVTSLSFSADDKQLATTAYDSKEIQIWNVATGEHVAVFGGHAGGCGVAKFSPDGKYLASGARRGSDAPGPDGSGLDTLRLWNVETGKTEQTLLGHHQEVLDLAFSRDGRLLASVGRDGALYVWEIPSGKKYGPLCSHASEATAVAFSPDGQTIVTGGYDGIRVWDVPQAIKQPEAYRLIGDELDSWLVYWHGGSFDLAFTADGKTLLTNLPNQWLGIWDFPLCKLRHKIPLEGDLRFDGLSSDGRLAAVHDHAHVLVYEIATGAERQRIEQEIAQVQFSQNGKLLLAMKGDFFPPERDMLGLRIADGAEAFSWAADERGVTAAAIAPNGKWLATAGEEKKIKIWRTSNRELVKTLDDRNGIRELRISPDGKQLAARNSSSIRVWDVQTDKCLLDRENSDIDEMLFLRDRKTLALASNNVILLWDIAAGKQIGELKGHPVNDEISSLAQTPDGQTLLSAGSHGSIKFWKVP